MFDFTLCLTNSDSQNERKVYPRCILYQVQSQEERYSICRELGLVSQEREIYFIKPSITETSAVVKPAFVQQYIYTPSLLPICPICIVFPLTYLVLRYFTEKLSYPPLFVFPLRYLSQCISRYFTILFRLRTSAIPTEPLKSHVSLLQYEMFDLVVKLFFL